MVQHPTTKQDKKRREAGPSTGTMANVRRRTQEEEAVKQELHALSPRSPLLLLLSAVEKRERDGQEKETRLSVVVVVFTTGSIRFSL